ncbi:MAG: hypothetical protein K8S00_01800 [Bacteroidales bacterium]|nr:hypothetical protein [Bacteroidales bacterium]
MKKLLIIILLTLSFWCAGTYVYAQPNPSNGSGGSPVGGAPVGSGIISLICLGLSYGFMKTLKKNRLN